MVESSSLANAFKYNLPFGLLTFYLIRSNATDVSIEPLGPDWLTLQVRALTDYLIMFVVEHLIQFCHVL